MEYVNGTRISVRNAGIDSFMSIQLISSTDFIIITPTSIKGDPTAQAGTDASNGVMKSARKKYPATVKAVIPVEDSLKAVTGDVPRSDPTTIADASDMNAKYCPSKSPLSST
ncbi:hypothetical protein Droror1_Dr00024325 [Drosera rotundifolia]